MNGLNPDFLAAARELTRHLPADLDAVRTYQMENGSSIAYGYDDNHQFYIKMPAWALRRFKKAMLEVDVSSHSPLVEPPPT